MRAVVQRVKQASVTVARDEVGRINHGLLILLAIHVDDTESMIVKMADKIMNLRIFEDQEGKMNLSVKDINGEIMVVSQFTLYGDCQKGNRPSFIQSARPEKAVEYYRQLVEYIFVSGIKVSTGQFGAYMEVALVNDGPTTVILDVN